MYESIYVRLIIIVGTVCRNLIAVCVLYRRNSTTNKSFVYLGIQIFKNECD